MICSYSATGNSRYVASSLAEISGETLLPMDDHTAENIPLDEDLTCVIPVYSWGPAPALKRLLSSIPDQIRKELNASGRFVNIVFTYGDETGRAHRMALSMIRKAGLQPGAIMGIQMPNNYVLLPGFNTDPADLVESKLTAASSRIELIASALAARKQIIDVNVGSLPWLKSLVYPLFLRWGVFPRKWKSGESCNSCGLCAKVCPRNNIRMRSGHPEWGDDCDSCLSCYHRCPRRAISYGHATDGKGHYFIEQYKNLLNKTTL